MCGFCNSHLLLLHELRVWTIVDDICAKDWCRQRTVDLLSVDILQLAVQDEIVALGAQADSGLLAQEDESEDISILCEC